MATQKKTTRKTRTTASKTTAIRATRRTQPERSVAGLQPADASRIVEEGDAFADRLQALLPSGARLTTDERIHTSGRLRDGEEDVLRVMIDAIAEAPAYFGGVFGDPNGVDAETLDRLRRQLDMREQLAPVSARIGEALQRLDDTLLQLSSAVRDPLLAAYEIARTVAQHDDALRGRIASVIDFYRRRQRRVEATPDEGPEVAEPANG